MARKQIEAKPTRYRNIQFRSRLEARMAVLLDYCNNVMNWDYEPCTFHVTPQNWYYTPDFKVRCYLRAKLSYIYLEVKPEQPSEEYLTVLREMTSVIPYPLFLFTSDFYNRTMDCNVIHQRRIAPFNPTILFSNLAQGFDHASKYRFDLRDK